MSYLPYLLQYLSMFISFLLRSFKDWWHFSYCLQHLWLSFVAKSGNPKLIGSILGFCLLSCWSVSQSWNKYLSKYTCLGKVNSGFIISLFKIFLNYSPVFFTWILIFYENFSILLRAETMIVLNLWIIKGGIEIFTLLILLIQKYSMSFHLFKCVMLSAKFNILFIGSHVLI